MGLFNAILGNASEVNIKDVTAEFEPILIGPVVRVAVVGFEPMYNAPVVWLFPRLISPAV